ncbi:LOW QUALITY PROTEIN: shootin-1-like [Polyodon spathula]|uniref:LOW QUALITY PROTEIN: shootin-1-like n=1 Tax=Polyodon spathula TaxID=7913 RepID=UPI001B7E2067|nr:LOW QUALITY PROTEIN: shootin-1-like [Polyodon spathula]
MWNVEDEMQMKAVTSLSNQAINEYESLQEQHKKSKQEYAKIQHERDEAVKKLREFQRLSHMVVEEVTVIQNNLEIEKSCRESAEALASKLNRENKSLKRLSMLYASKLGQEVITEEIAIDDEDSAVESDDGASICASLHCQHKIKDLHDKLVAGLEEKKLLVNDMESLKGRLEEVTDQLNKEKQENIILAAEMFQQKKLLNKYNRVSVLAADEYEKLQADFELEKDLRKEAESFAHKMLVEKKKLKRQSQLLLQNVGPNEQLLKAMEDVSNLTEALEKERIEHQQKMKEIEEKLKNSEVQREIAYLKRHVELLEMEKKEFEGRCRKSEEQTKDLKHTVDELQKQVRKAANPVPPPPGDGEEVEVGLPPPSSNPWGSLLSIIRKRKQPASQAAGLENSTEKDPGGEVTDIKQQALDEMMERIKKGVQLRPAGSRSKPQQSERKPSDSAVQELKGILSTFKQPLKTRLQVEVDSKNTETELERVLRRRRVLPAEGSESKPLQSTVSDIMRSKKQPGRGELSSATCPPTPEDRCDPQRGDTSQGAPLTILAENNSSEGGPSTTDERPANESQEKDNHACDKIASVMKRNQESYKNNPLLEGPAESSSSSSC